VCTCVFVGARARACDLSPLARGSRAPPHGHLFVLRRLYLEYHFHEIINSKLMAGTFGASIILPAAYQPPL
jgi:hypothetical protein